MGEQQLQHYIWLQHWILHQQLLHHLQMVQNSLNFWHTTRYTVRHWQTCKPALLDCGRIIMSWMLKFGHKWASECICHVLKGRFDAIDSLRPTLDETRKFGTPFCEQKPPSIMPRYKIPLAKGLLLTENLALQNHNKTDLIDIQLATFKNCEHGEFLLDQLSCRRNPR